MANLVLSGDTSGAITISAPSVAGTNTLTLPANTGTVITTASTFGGTGPSFSVTRATSTQSFTASTWTVIAYNSENWDTNNNFDTSNYRFTPTVAGYYQINVNVGLIFTGTSTVTGVGIYKNGSIYCINVPYATFNTNSILSVSGIVYLNGSTDYITGNVYSNGTSPSVNNALHETQMSGSLIRSA